MSYYDAEREDVKVEEIQGNPVYFYNGQFHVKVDEVAFKSKTMETLKANARKISAKPVKVIRFYVTHYGERLEILNAVGYSRKMVFEVDEDGKKHRVSSNNLYVHNPELEKELRDLSTLNKKLRETRDKTLAKATKFPPG